MVAMSRVGDIRSVEFENIFQLTISNYPALHSHKIPISANNINLLIERLEYFLSIRNHENPDYGIDWKHGFEREMMFSKVNVLGKELELFSGNEDVTILFLSQIENAIKNLSLLYWILVNNHAEIDEYISKNYN